MGVWYATREDVMSALDFKESARSNRRVDRAIESASRGVEGLLHRRFYPQLDTRTFDWPGSQHARTWRLWLDENEVISVSELVSGGSTIPSGDYFLRPDTGPPYTHVETDLDSTSAFSSAGTHQRAISITGVFGYGADEAPAGALAASVNASATTITVTDSSSVGVGTILRAGTERMTVTGKTMADTNQNTGAELTASAAAVTVAVTDGTAYAVDETLLIDAERMLVVDVAGNNLVVRRATDGSVLAAHSAGADIYSLRTLTVERAALGTTAAAHDADAALTRHTPPGLVRDLVIAEAIVQLQGETGGYAKVVRSGEAAIDVTGRGLADIRDRAYTAHGRKSRLRVV